MLELFALAVAVVIVTAGLPAIACAMVAGDDAFLEAEIGRFAAWFDAPRNEVPFACEGSREHQPD